MNEREYPSNEDRWSDLKVTFDTYKDAEELFYGHYPRSPIRALNPFNLKKPLSVHFQPRNFIDHCLYKTKVRRKYATFQRNADDFLHDRAVRMRWIDATLQDPDQVLRRKSDSALIYSCGTCDNEVSKVILKPGKIDRHYTMVTFHIAYPSNQAHRRQLLEDIQLSKLVYKKGG